MNRPGLASVLSYPHPKTTSVLATFFIEIFKLRFSIECVFDAKSLVFSRSKRSALIAPGVRNRKALWIFVVAVGMMNDRRSSDKVSNSLMHANPFDSTVRRSRAAA